MKSDTFSVFIRGIEFIRKNPQILATIFLICAIPLAFLFTSQQFLSVATQNAEQMERGRIPLIQDVFTYFASEHFQDPEYLRRHLVDVVLQNPTIIEMRIIRVNEAGEMSVLVSLRQEEQGEEYTIIDEQTKFQFAQAGINASSTALSKVIRNGTVEWLGIRAIRNESGALLGYLETGVTLAQIDEVARKNIRNAYVVLSIIIVLIFLLLVRHARIIDYTVLYQRLKEVDRMKDDFVSMAAHELRSPLTVIRGYVEMLQESTEFDEKGKKYLENIDLAATTLNTLVGDILDVSKLQEGRMTFQLEVIDVLPLIRTVVESFQRPASDKGLQLSLVPVEQIPQIQVDSDRFRQILINLVGNAIKYTPSGSVTISLNIQDDYLIIRVSDTGMGITFEDQQKLFQKFYRIKNKETELITGTGLGLWITNQMVVAMNGIITVESIRGKGTDFVVRFPLFGERRSMGTSA